MLAPHRLRNRPLEERRDDEFGLKERNRLDGDVVVDVELDGDLVAALRQLDVQPLGEAVEAVGEEKYFHFKVLNHREHRVHRENERNLCVLCVLCG